MKQKIFTCLTAGSILLLAGCASSPDSIPAQSVSTTQYEGYNCTQIAGEMNRVNDRIVALHADLKSKANNDVAAMAVGMLVFWPALFLLEGGDGVEANEYGRLRGEMDALQKVGVQKSCANLPEFDDPIEADMEAQRKQQETDQDPDSFH